MERRSGRIKARHEAIATKAASTNQSTGITIASSRNKTQRKSATSSALSSKNTTRRSTTATLAAQQNTKMGQQQTKRRKTTSPDDKEDSSHSVKVFRGMRGKLRQLTEFPLDILFEVCNSISRRKLAVIYSLQIFGHLQPFDLLRLARSTKTLRDPYAAFCNIRVEMG